MDCIKKQNLIRRVLMIGICLLVIWPFLWGSGPVFAFDVLPEDPVIFPQDPDQKTKRKEYTGIASNGQGYLCVWEQVNTKTGKDILGLMVDPNEPIQEDPNETITGDIINISKLPGNQMTPDIDFDGNKCLVVWSDTSTTNPGIHGALISPDGIMEKILIETGSNTLKFPKVKWNGELQHYLVAWEDWQDKTVSNPKISIHGTVVKPNGEIIDQEMVDPNGDIMEPKDFAVDSAFIEIAGIRASFDLASLEDPNMAYWVIAWNGNLQDPNVSGFDILLSFISEDPNGRLLFSGNPFQEPISENPFQIPIPATDQYYPSVEGFGNSFLVVWEDYWKDKDMTDKNILGLRIQLSASGIIPSKIINISFAPDKQTLPEVASNGNGYFVVWQDQRDSLPDKPVKHVYGVRISPEGYPLNDDPNASLDETPDGTRISDDDPNQIQIPYSLNLASTGSRDEGFFCFWSAREGDDWLSAINGNVWALIGRIYEPPLSPWLEWLGDPNYEEGGYEKDGVDPDSAPGGSPFTFKVKYFSPEEMNEKPETAQVWIDLNDDGSPGEEEVFDMSVEGGPVTDYTNGVIYSYSNSKILYDGDGILLYSFSFADKYNVAYGEPATFNTFQVDLDGNQPTLKWTDEPGYKEDGVRPDSAEWDTNMAFEFRVVYQDDDGDAPGHMELWIDQNGDGAFDPNHERFDMEAEGASSYQDGQIYTKTVTLKLDPGMRPIIYYKFESDDGKNRAFGFPRLGSYLTFNPLGETSACLNTHNQYFPSITSTGSSYQIFWQDDREKELDANRVYITNHIWMESLYADGRVKDDQDKGEPGQIKIDTSSKGAFKPLAQFNTDTRKTLVVWEDIRDGAIIEPSGDEENIFKPERFYEGLDIYGIFMDADGEPLTDTNGSIASGEFVIAGSTSSRNMLNPDIALGANGQHIVVWESESRIEHSEKTEIWAKFLRYPEGAYGERIWIQIDVPGRDLPGDGHQLMPKVAWDGEYYLAVWQDIASVDLQTGYYSSRIYGIGIDPNGKLYPQGLGFKFFNEQIMTNPNINQLFPDVASDGEEFLVVWQDSRSLDTERGYDIYGMRVKINGNDIDYLDLPEKEIPICTANGNQIRPKVTWDPQASQYIITWLEVPSAIPPSSMLIHRISNLHPYFPQYSQGGSIKVVRMDQNGHLIDSPSDLDKKDKYEGTSVVGVSMTQDRPDMACDPNLGCRLTWEDIRSNYSYDLFTASFQSTLNWIEDPNFINGIYPFYANEGSSFTFKIEYRDRMDNLPVVKSHHVWIDLNDDGIFGEDERFDMEVSDPNKPVSQGWIYTFSKDIYFPEGTDSDGSISYRFYFKTEEGLAKGEGSYGPYTFFVIPFPKLDWTGEAGFETDGVNPDQADSGTEFDFSVSYSYPLDSDPLDPEAEAKVRASQVWIDLNDDGEYQIFEWFEMEEDDPDDKDLSDGKVYKASFPISYHGDGIIKYRFFFYDGINEAIGDPASDELEHTFRVIKTFSDALWQTFKINEGLAGNFVTSLTIDQNNSVWAGFLQDPNEAESGGVSRFDGNQWETFRGAEYLPYNNNVISLTISPDNHLWVGTVGVSQFDGQTWKKFMEIEGDFFDVGVIAADDEGRIWAGANKFDQYGDFIDGGLAKYDSGEWTFYSSDIIGGNYISALEADPNGIIWIGINDRADPSTDPNIAGEKGEYKGIALFNPDKGSIAEDTLMSDYPGGDYVTSIYRDESGNIWVGSSSVETFEEDYNDRYESGNMLEGSASVETFEERYYQIGHGLSKYNFDQEVWTHYETGQDDVELGSNIITSIFRRGKDLWLGHQPESTNGLPRAGGATRHNLTKNSWRVFGNLNTPFGSPAFNYINDLIVDAEGNVWFGTPNGLVIFYSTDTILSFKDKNFVDGVYSVTGDIGDEFEFQVQYWQENKEGPDVAQVWIDLDDDGEYDTATERFNMDEPDPNDEDYFYGKIFDFSIPIDFGGDGTISYRFYFEKDGISVPGIPSVDHNILFEYLDWTGELGFKSDGVEPNQGKKGDKFNFKVKYVSPNNNPPDQGKTQVWIDKNANDIYDNDEKFDMNPESSGDTDYTDGRIYEYDIVLSYAGEGRIKYRFYFTVGGYEAGGTPSEDHYLSIFREKFWRMYTTEDGLSSNTVSSLVVDNKGRIWAGTIPPLGSLSGGGSSTDPYYDPNYQGTLPDVPDIGTQSGGVNIWDGNKWTPYYEADYDKDPNAYFRNYIICMAKDQAGNIWAGTSGGLIKYNNANPTQKTIYNAKNATEWGIDYITTLTAGKDNDIWIGTWPNIVEDPNTSTLRGGGLTRFDGSGKWTRYGPDVLEDNLITALAVDNAGKVWMGLAKVSYDKEWSNPVFSGLAVLNPETDKITRYRASSTDYLDDDHIRAISIQENDDVWVATGLNLLLPGYLTSNESTSGMGLTYYFNGKWREKFNSKNTNGEMLSNIVAALFVHEDSDIWMGSLVIDSDNLPIGGGINYFDHASGIWESFIPGKVNGELSSYLITDILVDDNGEVWAATLDGGVARYGYGEISEGVPLAPYDGLFNSDEESGCFITRIDGDSKINNRTIILFSIIICFILILIGFSYRRKTYKEDL